MLIDFKRTLIITQLHLHKHNPSNLISNLILNSQGFKFIFTHTSKQISEIITASLHNGRLNRSK